jgi:hypothetical protein
VKAMKINKIIISLLSIGILFGCAHAQVENKDNLKVKIVRRIKIKSIDPQLLALLLKGNHNFLLPSEITLPQLVNPKK